MAKKKPRPYDKYDDIQKAELFGAYFDNEGDIDKTYIALKKKVTKTALRALEKDQNWKALYQYENNKWMKHVADEALDRKKKNLAMLHNVKVRAYGAIVGAEDKDGNKVTPVRPKTQGEAVESLIRAIEKEAELLGDKGADDGPPAEEGLLAMVLKRYFAERDQEKKEGKEEPEKDDEGPRAEDLGIVFPLEPNKG